MFFFIKKEIYHLNRTEQNLLAVRLKCHSVLFNVLLLMKKLLHTLFYDQMYDMYQIFKVNNRFITINKYIKR